MYSEGFKHAKALSVKLVAIFTLSKQLLSPQQHYDWGLLKTLKTILSWSGQLLAAEKKQQGTLDLGQPVEETILIKALRINTVEKLTHSDTEAFNALVGDVFPGANVTDVNYEALEKAILKVLEEEKLETLSLQVRKILQFYEATMQRMGVVVVGPSGCGKSTIWRVLKLALAQMGQKIPTYVMNPKSMPREQLLGHMDMYTHEWFDGVLTASARKVVREPPDVKSWIICDGDIDPEWVESLNSVLDDNRLLTMPSGERIQFGPNVNFIFETHDLKFASPATVSRMGMIFLDQESSDVKCIVSAWLKKQPAELQMKLDNWLSEYFFKVLDWVLAQDSAVVDTTKAGIVVSALSHLHGVASKAEFVCAAIRGFGSNLMHTKRAELAKLLYSWTGEMPADHRRPLDGFFNVKRGVHELYTQDTSQQLTFDDFDTEGGAMVRTAAVQRDEHMLLPWMERMEPLILVGPEGCGKHMLLSKLFAAQRGTHVAVVHCSAQTLASHVIHKLSSVCQMSQTQTGRVYRPKDAARVVLYLKDINLPKPDKYETAELVAFLQQLVTYQGFYDKNLDFVGLQNIHLVASMNPSTTVGRYPLSTRFTANVRLAYVGYPEKESLYSIYTALNRVVLARSCAGSATWDTLKAAEKLATCMVDIFEQVRRKFSVDEQRHYLFTPRDLTQWVRGLLRYELAEASQPLLDTWAFEGARMLRDRLVDSRATSRFDAIVAAALRQHFDFAVEESRKTIFSSLLGGLSDRAGAMPDRALTLKKAPTADFEKIVQQGLKQYEREMKELGLVLFPEALNAVARMDRVLSQPGGNLLLVGASGVGRRSALSLVCHMHGLEVFTPMTGRDYSLKSFKAELKAVLPKVGVQGTAGVLLLEDHQLRDEALIECVNSLLSSGEVPGLFEPQELEPMLAPLKEEMSKSGYKHRTLYDLFVHRVQQFLHVALLMDPTNKAFLMRCESNPALYTRCSMLWMGSWSQPSMEALASTAVGSIEEEMLPSVQKPLVLKQMVQLHQRLEMSATQGHHADATPRMYVALTRVWRKIYVAQRKKISDRVEHLSGGLAKLAEAEKEVARMSKTANEQRALLTQKQQEADQAMEMIQKSMEGTVEKRREVEHLQLKLGKEEVEMTKQKAQVEEELRGIQPVLDAAKQAVGGIKKDNLNEIRSLKMPPEAIRDVLEGVLKIMGNFDTTWVSMKRFLGSSSVKEDILNFDSRKITPEIRDAVQDLLDKRGNSFEHAVIHRVSVAASPLAAWVKANLEYSAVLIRIAPLQNANDRLVAELESSKDRLGKCEAALRHLDVKVQELKNDFAKRTAEAESLKASLRKAEEVLGSAQEMLGKLAGERTRWDAMMAELNASVNAMAGSSLLAAGFLVYLADETEHVRKMQLEEWHEAFVQGGLLTSKGPKVGAPGGFSMQTFLSTEGELLRWKGQGLPTDKLSSENAIVILNAHYTPLIIDPSSQALEWLKTNLQAGGGAIEVLVPHEPRFANALELGVRFGKTLVLQEVDKIEPILVPLLRKDLTRQGPRFTVQVGDKAIDYTEGFRMFLATRNPTPELPPDVASLISLVNFSVTLAGLEEQLLGVTIQHEQPVLEQQKMALLAAEDKLKIELEGMEQKLLLDLAASEGNLLENKALIDSLNTLKSASVAIQEKLVESSQLQLSLDGQREVFRPIAKTGSLLFFTLLDLQRINSMYKYSLPMFLRLFHQALDSRQLGHAPPADRTRLLSPLLQQLVFGSVARSLFKADRLTYAMHLIHLLHPRLFAGDNDAEWQLFTGKVLVAGGGGPPLPRWAHAERAPAFAALAQAMPQLASLPFADPSWAKWASSERCEVDFPPSLPPATTPFQRILLVQALRPERLQYALTNFVMTTLSIPSLSPSSSALLEIARSDSHAAAPILMITTAGADPTQELEDIAAREMAGRYKQLAMGGQQCATAITMVREAAKNGNWLCLKNLHLVVHWVPQLEKELSSLTLPANSTFRLWLTTEQHPAFPTILLQQSLKLTCEAPPGLQKNLQRSYESLMHKEFVEKGPPARAQLLFVLSWFHAVLQERRTYIPQGWTKFYEFSPADLRSAADICDSAIGLSQGNPDWVTIHGLLGSAVYGGRVDQTMDERLLHTYLQQYFSTAMLSPGSRGSIRLAPGVSLPTTNAHADYVALISQLPSQDSPSLFGLPANADVAVQQRSAVYVQQSLRTLGTDPDASTSFDREKWAAQLTPLLTLWGQLSTQCEPMRQAPAGRPDATSGQPVDTIVALEVNRAKALLRLVDESTGAIARVVRGTELLNATTKAQGNALVGGAVPSVWQEVWEGPEEPVAWMKQAVAKVVALARWQQQSLAGALLQGPLRLNELLSPSFFLTALRQQTARLAKVPMDSLRLSSALEPQVLSNASLRVRIDGLLLQGADCAPPQGLHPLAPDAPTLSEMPPLHLAWVPSTAPEPYPLDRSALLPLYLDLNREVQLGELRLPCSGVEAAWLQAGAALFLSGADAA